MNNKMTVNTYLSKIESKKQAKQEELRQNHGYRECFEGASWDGGVGGGGTGEGIKKYK